MTPRTLASLPKRRTAGQTMVLGCVTLLMMALMLMLSFNLTNAIHEKMRLQTHSDVMAYSAAVLEARSFNYFAYTNRASAALLVAQMTVHAYMSTISMIPSILRAGEYSFFEIMGEEIILACTCQPFCCNVEHWIDAGEAIVIALDYGSESDDWAQKVSDLDKDFNDAVDILQKALGVLNAEQQATAGKMFAELVSGSALKDLKTTNAQYASDPSMLLGAYNAVKYACALEGTVIDSLCIGGPSVSDKEARARVMSDVANASRPTWDKGRTAGAPLGLWFEWLLPKKYRDIQNEGIGEPLPYFGGSAGLVESVCDIDGLNKGSNVCSKDSGLFFAQWRHGFGVAPYDSKIASGSDPAHDPSAAHSDEHDKFKGVQNDDGLGCALDGNCFVNFRSTEDTPDFNQPPVFAFHTQDLHLRVRGGDRPWELNSKHEVGWGNQDHGGGILNLAPSRDGKAISKAQVYFHRFDDWKFPPNMFDPYWRAKLHPFTKTEAMLVTGLVDSDAIVPAGLVIEGDGP